MAARQVVTDVVVDQWGDRLIRSWNEGWWDLQLTLGDLLAPIIGARPGEVIISDSTSVNLFKLAAAAVTAAPDRHTIVTDDLNFPTDIYVLEGVARRFGEGTRLVVVESDGINGPLDALAEAVDDDTALVALSHTAFKSGYTYDMGSVTEMVHDAGAMMLWDTSHSVGVVPVELESSGADLAVGCTYKYLNGGPGSPAFLYVRRDLQETLENPITAWWGHADPFGFEPGFRPVHGIRRFHTGTMPVISLAAIEAGIRDVLDAGVDRIRAKSVASDRISGRAVGNPSRTAWLQPGLTPGCRFQRLPCRAVPSRWMAYRPRPDRDRGGVARFQGTRQPPARAVASVHPVRRRPHCGGSDQERRARVGSTSSFVM